MDLDIKPKSSLMVSQAWVGLGLSRPMIIHTHTYGKTKMIYIVPLLVCYLFAFSLWEILYAPSHCAEHTYIPLWIRGVYSISLSILSSFLLTTFSFLKMPSLKWLNYIISSPEEAAQGHTLWVSKTVRGVCECVWEPVLRGWSAWWGTTNGTHRMTHLNGLQSPHIYDLPVVTKSHGFGMDWGCWKIGITQRYILVLLSRN